MEKIVPDSSSRDDLVDFGEEPLSAVELKKIRRIIRDQERMSWFWASARIWTAWIAATLAALFAAKDYIVKAVKGLLS